MACLLQCLPWPRIFVNGAYAAIRYGNPVSIHHREQVEGKKLNQ
jgi:hypothetical protein